VVLRVVEPTIPLQLNNKNTEDFYMSRNRHLKIKIINLADEARTIRHEENKLHSFDKKLKDGGKQKRHYPERVVLADHRRGVVRDAARCNLLAYAFLRGMPYERAESPNTTKEIDWARVKRIVKTFGGDPDAVQDWWVGRKEAA